MRRMTDRPWVIAALAPLPESAWPTVLGDLDAEIVLPPARDQAGVRAALARADLVFGDWSAQLRIGAAEVADAPHLVLVQQPSVGVEIIDLDALAARGIAVANAAGANAVSVAEWCLGATLALLRHLVWAHVEVAADRWPTQPEIFRRGSSELAGKRVGLVGFGDIGVACARLYSALGCDVSYWSRRQRSTDEAYGVRYRDLGDLVTTSDVLVVVVALAAGTRGLLDAERIATMPAGAYLVNAARGHIVDEAAVASAVREGRLRGAAFDVFATEPLPAGSPLHGVDGILLSPHAAGSTEQAVGNVMKVTVDNLRRAIAGEPVHAVRNGVSPLIQRR